MKTTSICLVLAMTLLSTGCAVIHRGIYAVPVDEKGAELEGRETPMGMVISSRRDNVYSDEHFTFVRVTLENRAQDWIRIREAYVDFGNQTYNQNILITSGQDIAAWHEATENRLRAEEARRASFLAVIGAIGAIAAHSDNEGVAAAGAVTFLGAATSLTAMDMQRNLRDIEGARIFPENHLLVGNLHIPPASFVRRFILFQTRDKKIAKNFDHFFLTYQTEDGQAETVKAVFYKERKARKPGMIN